LTGCRKDHRQNPGEALDGSRSVIESQVGSILLALKYLLAIETGVDSIKEEPRCGWKYSRSEIPDPCRVADRPPPFGNEMKTA
jgi:hypothetical protein